MRWQAGAVVVVLACFAFNSLATRFVVSRGLLDAPSVTVARFAAGAVTLALLLALQGRAREAWPTRRDAPLVLFLGGYALAIAYGYLHITAAAGTFVFYALVVATMTAGGAAPSRRALAGAAVALVGVGVLAVGRVEGTTLLGVALLALTGATWGAYSLALRGRGGPLATNARAFIGVALLLPLLVLAEQGDLRWTWPGIAIGIVMGAVTTGLAYALWARVLPTLTPIQAGTVQLAVPVLTAAGGVALLAEPFGPRLGLAGTLVLLGMALTLRQPQTAPAASTTVHPHAAIIERFYAAFEARDAETMAACYHDDVTFRDPVFGELRGEEARDMWRMLVARAEGLQVRAHQVRADDHEARVRWEATYRFGRQKRVVRNRVDARFTFREEKILRHEDTFDLWRWASMALGPTGTLLGWAPPVRARIRAQARAGLAAFRAKR